MKRRVNVLKLISSIWLGLVLFILLLIGWSDLFAGQAPKDCTVVAVPIQPMPTVRTVRFAQSCRLP